MREGRERRHIPSWVVKWGIPGTLSALLVAQGVFSLQQARTVQTLRQQVATAQQRAMLEVLSTLSDIEMRLSKLLVSSGAVQGEKLLGDLVRQAEGVQSNLSQLPLRHEAISGTMKFVNQLGDYAGVLSQNITQGRPLSSQDLQQLEGMLANCAQLNEQLRGVEQDIVSGKAIGEAEQIFWQDQGENPPTMEQAAGKSNGIDYPSLVYDGPFSDGKHAGAPLALAGMPQISVEQAMQAAVDFVGKERVRDVRRGINTQGVIPAYGVTVETEDGTLNVQVTQQGGQILWMMPESAGFGSGLDVGACALKAYEFLTAKGYGHVEPNYWQTYDGIAVINFATVQDGALLYPDLVKVQVRMDTGAVVGLEANNYLMNHHARTGLASVITKEEAAEMVSDRLEVDRVRLCIIPTERGERLCYEFGGDWSGSYYLVYIDAKDKQEINILKIIDTEGGRMSV
ncbi:MAG: germination protein YpeB [Oscillospiraceae bacterium]|jgi:germination protein YpeB|nr:germination protein YpeB [Oscillospiraceae bacterium]